MSYEEKVSASVIFGKSFTDFAITTGEIAALSYLTDTSRLKLDSNGYFNILAAIGGFFLVKYIEHKIRHTEPGVRLQASVSVPSAATTVPVTQTAPQMPTAQSVLQDLDPNVQEPDN